MIDRKVELRRNSFFVFMLRVLPIVFWGGIVSIWAFRVFDTHISKYFAFFFLMVAIVCGLVDLKNNRRVLSFSQEGLSILKKKKDDFVVEKMILRSEIVGIECVDESKKIVLQLNNNKRFNLLEYNSARVLGAKNYFMAKSELCRYFPDRAHEYIDDEVKSYIESGIVSEYVNSQEQTGRAQAGILFFAEFVFAIIPLGLSIFATIWVFLGLLSGILKGLLILFTH